MTFFYKTAFDSEKIAFTLATLGGASQHMYN
jgi:hypothetical protein